MAETGVFWDALLQLISEGRVVPVVGQDLTVVETPEGPELLCAYLARRLAEYLGVSAENLTNGSEINDVACRHLAQGNSVEDVYPALIKVSSDAAALPIPEPLRQLAEIRPFTTFVTTTFDSLLLRALNQSRFGGQPKTLQLAYAPSEIEDLPPNFKTLTVPVVYHLFGKVSATPTFAATHEDIVEYFHALQSETRRPNLLFDELNRQSLLVLGSRFGGWLTRFLMRMAKQQRLSAGGKNDYIADADLAGDKNLVLFLKSFSRSTKLYSSGGAVEFVAELHRRWKEKERNLPAVDPGVQPDATAVPIEPGAVFLSY
ncbi:MAG: SIR2 family protein, partial [Candidatus Solibacter sp.]